VRSAPLQDGYVGGGVIFNQFVVVGNFSVSYTDGLIVIMSSNFLGRSVGINKPHGCIIFNFLRNLTYIFLLADNIIQFITI